MYSNPPSNKAVGPSKDHLFIKDCLRGGASSQRAGLYLPEKTSLPAPPYSCHSLRTKPVLSPSQALPAPSSLVHKCPEVKHGHMGTQKTGNSSRPRPCRFPPEKTHPRKHGLRTPITDCALSPLSSLPVALRHPNSKADTQPSSYKEKKHP